MRRLVTCPQCGKAAEYSPANAFRPFCSERCKLIDMGAWASGAYRIPAQSNPDEEPTDGTTDAPPATS